MAAVEDGRRVGANIKAWSPRGPCRSTAADAIGYDAATRARALDFNRFIVRPPKTLTGLCLTAAALAVASIAANGLAFSDPALPDYWRTMSLADVPPQQQFLLGNAFYNLLGHGLTRLFSPVVSASAVYHTLAALSTFGAFALVIGLTASKLGVERAAIFLGCLALSILDNNLLRWMGKTDAYLVAIYALIYFHRTHVGATAAGFFFLAGFHTEQALFIALNHLLMLRLEDAARLRHVAAVSVGLGLAIGARLLYEDYFSLAEARDRIGFATDERSMLIFMLVGFFKNWAVALFTVLFGAWWLAFNAASENRRTLLYLALAVAIAAGIAAITIDYTRVASLLAMPVIFYLAGRAAATWREGEGLSAAAAATYGLAAIIAFEVYYGAIRGHAGLPGLSLGGAALP